MRLSVDELLADFVFVVVLIGASVALFATFMNVLYPVLGVYVGFSEGFSMCPARSAYLDYLGLSQSGSCAIVPGDVLIAVYWAQPDLNDIVCATTTHGIVCHRVCEVHGDYIVLCGDNADWKLKVTQDNYVGTVVAKLPRAFGIPGMAFAAVRDFLLSFFSQVNAGGYPAP